MKGKDVTQLFRPFLEAVRPILDAQRGTLVVKIADVNHANGYRFQAADLWQIAQELGWRACGRVGIPRPPAGDDPKWIAQFSLPTGVTDWLVFHVAARCPQRVGLPRPRNHRCVVCGRPFRARSDAKTDSPACRQRLRRRGVVAE